MNHSRHRDYGNEPLNYTRKNRVLPQNSPLELEKCFKTTNLSIGDMDKLEEKEITTKRTVAKKILGTTG